MAHLAVRDARDQTNQFRLVKRTLKTQIRTYLVEKGQTSAIKTLVHTQTMEQNDIDRSSEISWNFLHIWVCSCLAKLSRSSDARSLHTSECPEIALY